MKPEEIKATRARLGLTQAELAEKLGCAQPRITEWETGRFKISPVYQRMIKLLIDN